MANIEADKSLYFLYMLIGAIGLIAIGIYIILKILLYLRKKAKAKSAE